MKLDFISSKMMGNAEGVGAPCSGFENLNSGAFDAEGKGVEVSGVQAGRTVVPEDSEFGGRREVIGTSTGETVAQLQLGRAEHKLRV